MRICFTPYYSGYTCRELRFISAFDKDLTFHSNSCLIMQQPVHLFLDIITFETVIKLAFSSRLQRLD